MVVTSYTARYSKEISKVLGQEHTLLHVIEAMSLQRNLQVKEPVL